MFAARSLVASRSVRSGAALSTRRFISGGTPKKGVNSIVEADTGVISTKYYHLTSLGLLVASPVAFMLSPSMLNFPIDLFLGIAFPIHAHIGVNYIISDYVPKASRPVARYALLGATAITLLGLLKLNISGPGVTETYKSLWREPSDEKHSKH